LKKQANNYPDLRSLRWRMIYYPPLITIKGNFAMALTVRFAVAAALLALSNSALAQESGAVDVSAPAGVGILLLLAVIARPGKRKKDTD